MIKRLSLLLAFLPFFIATPARAFVLWPDCISNADKAQAAGLDCIKTTVSFYIGLLTTVIAIAAFLYLLYGAFLMITSAGEEDKISQGKKVITTAVIGVILALASKLILLILANWLKVSISF